MLLCHFYIGLLLGKVELKAGGSIESPSQSQSVWFLGEGTVEGIAQTFLHREKLLWLLAWFSVCMGEI